MKRSIRILSTVIVSSVLFLSACKSEESEGDAEEPPDLTLFDREPEDVAVSSRYTNAVGSVLGVKKAYAQTIEERRKKYAEIAEAREKERQRIEAERLAEIARKETERKRVEAERQRKVAEEKAQKASQVAQAQKAQAPPSRASDYVGQAQTYEATFYTAYCPTGCTGVTASGYVVSSTIYYEGMRVLAAPKHIPFYSIMRVTYADGSSFDGIVLDRGGDIGAGRLDILVSSRDEAYALGRKAVQVQMVRKGR